MRCTTCDYPLWNLNARECPECGSRFAPSEFEFVAGSVQFCCPHCQQVYYGTGDNGHLRPVEFDCVSCSRHVHMDEMLLRPADGLEDRDTTVDDVPWLERKRIGFFKGWLGTIWKSLVAPHRLMNAMPRDNATGHAWWFMLLTVFASTAVTFGGWILLMVIMDIVFGGGGGMGMIFMMIFGGYWLVSLGITVVFVAIWGLTVHGLLRLTGTTHDSIGRTYSALCYASGPFVLMAVPCVGAYIAMPWWVVAAVLMVYSAQRVSGWRATLSVLTLPALSLLSIIGGYVWLLLYLVPVMQGGFATGMTMVHTASIQSTIIQHGTARQGEGPLHIVEAIDGFGVTLDSFVLPGSHTQMTAVPIGDSDLWSMSIAGRREFSRLAELAVESMPENVIAHRLGDFVFTYHGIDLRSPDPDLWIFISCADPDQNQTAAIDGKFYIGGATGGDIDEIPAEEFLQRLEEQNDLRKRLDLPPLPHPWQVTHSQPAVAEPNAMDEE